MRLALAQIDMVWEEKEKNLKLCEAFIRKSKTKSIDLILFPEMTLTGFTMNVEEFGEDDNFSLNKMKFYAKKYNIAIGFGHIEKFFLDNKIMGKNIYSIISNNGEVLINYNKIHPFSFGDESLHYLSGEEIHTCNINNIAITPFICYDLRFPEIFQIASKNSHLITVAANWPESRIDHFKTLIKARAIENQCYIAGVNRVGKGNELTYNGFSMIVDPLGKEINSLEDTEGLVIGEIDEKFVNEVRKNFKVKNDRKEELYLKLFKDMF
ncbi:MAG: carbon-nitrogen family hydrolase [Clostridium argentinense]|uniref:Carbon-nitrogen family hydrolase n=1 Tax=Clostridium faecium TaxID=2762223 RepID=A0ABR8YTZ1_9CLOT|nr:MULTISPECIES: nitrilase-related carbon-nitrogen hydrolase [Clostridium]MBD8047732.1 carbon-nitrogen family hydrolase [Clostridium faecium]MBS5823814.1 carbon-nitrogen family hydrolase [Clostridium argentinense]MDU1348076.1 nitrilase-related carbon-nitrogen hydrolase [Clostridium argentinense]